MRIWKQSLTIWEVVPLVGRPTLVDQQAVVFACSPNRRPVQHSIAEHRGMNVCYAAMQGLRT